MGCSSSSAQVVEQEKRPGIKPEDSTGDTIATKNGIIAEGAQTIEDQIQLPVQTAIPNNLLPGTDDEEQAMITALEAQEDLGSGEDLLATPEPQLKPADPAEPPEEAVAPLEVTAEPEATDEVVEAVETVVADVPEIKALPEAPAEAPASEFVVAVQAEMIAAVEEVTSVEPEACTIPGSTVSGPAETPVVTKEAAALMAESHEEVATPVDPTDDAAPVESRESSEPTEQSALPASEAAAPCDSSTPEPVPSEAAAPCDSSTPEPLPSEAAVPEGALAPTDGSAPASSVVLDEATPLPVSSASAETTESVIDTDIAKATIPEMSPLDPTSVEAQLQSQPAVVEETVPPMLPAETPPVVEASTLAESTPTPSSGCEPSGPEVVQEVEVPASAPGVPEVSSGTGTSESEADGEIKAEAPAEELTTKELSAPADRGHSPRLLL